MVTGNDMRIKDFVYTCGKVLAECAVFTPMRQRNARHVLSMSADFERMSALKREDSLSYRTFY